MKVRPEILLLVVGGCTIEPQLVASAGSADKLAGMPPPWRGHSPARTPAHSVYDKTAPFPSR